jgi:hypothetical protein
MAGDDITVHLTHWAGIPNFSAAREMGNSSDADAPATL